MSSKTVCHCLLQYGTHDNTITDDQNKHLKKRGHINYKGKLLQVDMLIVLVLVSTTDKYTYWLLGEKNQLLPQNAMLDVNRNPEQALHHYQ